MSQNKGKFIVIDGGEGSGKGTVMEHLKSVYTDAVFTREPGGSLYAEEIRKLALESEHAKSADALTQFFLMLASRRDHGVNKILPSLKEGKNVFSDRFDTSTWAYQVIGQKGGIALGFLFLLIRFFLVRPFAPDLYIILEVSPEEGARRVAERKGKTNHFDDRKREFHERVLKGYRMFGLLIPFKVVFIDANKSREEVVGEVRKAIELIIKK